MKSKYPLVNFAKILNKFERKFKIEDSIMYNCAGVKWHGKGVFLRESKKGFQVLKKDQHLIKENDIIYNKLFAWKGAFAIVNKINDGLIASDKFPTYLLNSDLIIPKYLKLFFETDEIKKQATELSRGGASISKFTLNPPQFYDLQIPLPNKVTQQRIVDKIGILFRVISLLIEERNNQINLIKSLYSNQFNKIIEKKGKENSIRSFLIPYSNQIKIDDSKNYKQLTVKMNCKGVILRREVKGNLIRQKNQNKVKYGQFIFSKIDARSGALGIIPKEFDGAIVSKDFPSFELNTKLILPEFFKILFSDKNFIKKCADSSMGTTNRRRLKVEIFLDMKVNLPSIKDQEDIIKKMNLLNDHADQIYKYSSLFQEKLIILKTTLLNEALSGYLVSENSEKLMEAVLKESFETTI